MEHGEQRESDFATLANIDGPDVMMRDEGNETRKRDIESESQDSEGSGATMDESIHSLEMQMGMRKMKGRRADKHQLLLLFQTQHLVA